MSKTQSSSPPESPQDKHRELAMKLASACVNPSYMPELWALYVSRFCEVLAAEATEKP